VFRALRIAGKPQFRPGHGAPCHSLLHEGPGHEHHLIQQHAGQGDALDQLIGALILGAEEVVDVLTAAGAGDGKFVLADRQPKIKKSNALLLQIIGGVLMFAAALSIPEYLGWVLLGEMNWLSGLLQMIALGVAGCGMFIAGRRMSAAMKRYARYLAVMGDRAAVSIEELARTLGYSHRQVEKDLHKMLDKDYFGAAAYLNEELGYLFRTATADEELTRSRKEAAKTASVCETEEGFSGILRNIRRANDRIADPVLSGQIDRLEDITARIFERFCVGK
jgi:hypothetical protein